MKPLSEMKLHWAEKHRWRDPFWLSGSDPQTTLRWHRVDDKLTEARRVLDIGVGTGGMAKYLHEAGHNVYCVDIVEDAFQNCKPHCDMFSDIAGLHHFRPLGMDLAICHLVAQCCSDDVLMDLLLAVLRHLHDGGILSIQFAAPFRKTQMVRPQPPPEKGSFTSQQLLDDGMLKLRWPHEFEKLVHQAGGHIVDYVFHRQWDSEGAIRHYICHVKKGKRQLLGDVTDLYTGGRPRLSLLIPTIPARNESFQRGLYADLSLQAAGKPVEILTFGDNLTRTVGDKRNALLQMARGDYLAFIDDDDRVSPDYVDEILMRIRQNPDTQLITFSQMVILPGTSYQCRYATDLPDNQPQVDHTERTYAGPPAHTHVWRTSFVKDRPFASRNYGEDSCWAWELARHVAKQETIPRTLYYYHFDPENSATRKQFLSPARNVNPMLVRPDVDNTRHHVADRGDDDTRVVKASIVIATYNKAALLRRTLQSIFRQRPVFNYEVIVVDHGSTDDTPGVVDEFYRLGQPIRYEYLANVGFTNPAAPRNLGYRLATGEVIISQSDDVVHASPETIQELVAAVTEANFVIAEVHDVVLNDDLEIADPGQKPIYYSGRDKSEFPLFFLGAVLREHVFAIGGNSLRFHRPGFDDNWFTDCLQHGLGLTPTFPGTIGYHQRHTKRHVPQDYEEMEILYKQLKQEANETGVWLGEGPWPYV